MKLSIVVPFYNEQDTVLVTLGRLANMDWPEFVESTEIICVNDASSDESMKRVTDFVEQKENFRVFEMPVNSGKGAAVRYGFEQATGDVFFIQDADLELLPSDIPSMLIAMHELKVEFVNGSRYLPGLIRPISSYRRYIGNKYFTFVTSVLINVKLTDMACGYKLITRNLYEQINLKENRFGFEAELIMKALRIKRNNVAEVPVHYFPRNVGQGKKLRTIDALRVFRTIFLYGVLRLK
ncbi:MAG: glycosyltransferase family 2 protein [Crocinitomicaceae bacterium]|nr:glycosyltransferase family 2 protein [Crocinitomicaceae bacterium]